MPGSPACQRCMIVQDPNPSTAGLEVKIIRSPGPSSRPSPVILRQWMTTHDGRWVLALEFHSEASPIPGPVLHFGPSRDTWFR